MSLLREYTIALLAIRYLLPISTVALLTLTGIDLTMIGLPVISALLAAAIVGGRFARQTGHRPGWRTWLGFSILGSVIFFVVNYTAYAILAVTGIGPIYMAELLYWVDTGIIYGQMIFLTTVAFLANSILFPAIVKAELKGLARRAHKQSDADADEVGSDPRATK